MVGKMQVISRAFGNRRDAVDKRKKGTLVVGYMQEIDRSTLEIKYHHHAHISPALGHLDDKGDILPL